jgi:hypothetical protein
MIQMLMADLMIQMLMIQMLMIQSWFHDSNVNGY